MVDLTEFLNKTVSHIDSYYERNNRVSYSKYLAVSELGEVCSRKLWYKFRNYLPKEHVQGKLQRIFDTGQEQENRVIKALQSFALVGHSQARVGACNGHLQGAIDFQILGLPEAPKTEHLGECKSHNDKNFKVLQKLGVENGYFKHFLQMQIYGRLRGLTKYFYIAINKNDENIYQERGDILPAFVDAQIARADRIINSEAPPARIGEDGCFDCKFCQFAGICHRGEPHHVNSRNDGTTKPGPEGKWINVHPETL